MKTSVLVKLSSKALLTSFFAFASNASAADVVLIPDGDLPPAASLISLVNSKSGRCADVTGSATTNAAKLQQLSCDGSDKQKFWLTPAGNATFTLKAKHSARCLDVLDQSLSDGAKIQQWDCHGGQNQAVRILMVDFTSFKLQFNQSGKCLSVTDASLKDGATLEQSSCSSAANQLWFFKI